MVQNFSNITIKNLMINTGKTIALSIIVLLAGCYQKSEYNTKDKLSGLWSLYTMEQYDKDTGKWKQWRNGMQGFLLYDGNDNMALHLTSLGYEDTDLQFPNFIDTIPIEALKHLTKSYVYMAKYSIDEENSIVKHSRISHSNPGEWNSTVQRRFSFNGDTLILRPVEEKTSGLRLKWLRSLLDK